MPVYAKAPVDVYGDDGERYITAGRRYEVTPVDEQVFKIRDDDGDLLFCLWRGCAHIDYGDWQRVEVPDVRLTNMSDMELADFALANGLDGGVSEEIADRFLSHFAKTTNGPRDFRGYFTNKENPNHASA